MITLKIGRLSSLIDPITALIGLEISPSKAVKLAGMVKLINEQLKSHDEVNQSILNTLREKYAIKNEDGTYKVDENNMLVFETDEKKQDMENEYVVKYNELLNTDVEFAFDKLILMSKDLGDGVKIKTETLMALSEVVGLEE